MKNLLTATCAVAFFGAACIPHAHADIVQIGEQKYSINNGDERSNAREAQAFCRHNGFDFAHVTWTKPAFTIFDHDTTDFFCMHHGDVLTRPPSIDLDILD